MIYSLTVGKNEEHRYLESMMQAASETFDGCFFYDDRSEDNTYMIAQRYANATIRPHQVSSFVENEGGFREAAWREFEQSMNPNENDWVCVLDTDEVFVGSGHFNAKQALRFITANTASTAVNISIPEVFGFSNHTPMVRIDRLWGTIFAPRLFRYRHSGVYAQAHYGVPSVPTYVSHGSKAQTSFGFILHYGYARDEDRIIKYRRYKGQPGHSHEHVESILQEPTLQRWQGSFDMRMQRNGNS